MTRACGECSKPCKKHGNPQRVGTFLDQIVVCTKCGWVGVETETVEQDTFIQLDMFQQLEKENNHATPNH